MFEKRKEEKRQVILQALYNLESKVIDLLNEDQKIISFTSTSKHTEQISLVYKMAKHMAEDGYKILIIDANLRDPQLEDVTGNSKERGFIDSFLGGHPFDNVVDKDLDYKNLDLVYTGIVTDYADKFLEANDIRNFFDSIRDRYDYIFLNTTPNIDIPESNLFSAMADKVIVLTTVDNSETDILAKSIKQLEKVDCQILGLVITNYVFSESEKDELFGGN